MSAFIIHAMAGLLLAAAAPQAESHYGTIGYWTILTMVGSLGASMMAFTLNRITENPRAVIGRVIGAMFTGIALPRFLLVYFPSLASNIHDPIILVACGFLCALLGYTGAAAAVEKMFKVAPSIVDQQMNKLAEAVSVKVVEKTAEAVASDPTQKSAGQ